jgi:hypothetical protein
MAEGPEQASKASASNPGRWETASIPIFHLASSTAARLSGFPSGARVTQIMNLLNLAPDIQEEILFLPCTIHGRDPIPERHLRPLVAIFDWRKQRKMWRDQVNQCLLYP